MKLRNIVLVIAGATLLAGCTVYAEGVTTAENITFRGIEWLSKEDAVKKEVEQIEGIHPYWNAIEEDARIEGWHRQYSMMYSDPNVEGGGVELNYEGLTVAGYNARLNLSFMYPVENGRVSHVTEDSLFYMARYDIQDVEDIEGAYEDITTKLVSLYGEPLDNSYYNDFDELYNPKGKVWTATDGSIVWLAAYYNSYSEKYDECTITYAAPGTEEMLTALAAEVQADTFEDEATARDENVANTDGL